MNLNHVLGQLKSERARMVAAIQALEGSMTGRGTLSAAARAKIAAAQRRRWAKVKTAKKGK